jgi:hypothetical protein
MIFFLFSPRRRTRRRAYVSMRQHTSAHVSIRMPAYLCVLAQVAFEPSDTPTCARSILVPRQRHRCLANQILSPLARLSPAAPQASVFVIVY